MTRIFARNLRDKQVMSSDGVTLGILNNFVIDVRSGALVDLVIKPDIALDKERYHVQDDFLLVPFDAVRSIKDYVVVDKNLSKARARVEMETDSMVEDEAQPQESAIHYHFIYITFLDISVLPTRRHRICLMLPYQLYF